MYDGAGMSVPRHPLSDAERLDWLRLIRTENVGPITFFRLIERYGTAAAAMEALPDLAQRGGRIKPLKVASRAAAEREMAANAQIGARLIAACEPDYPEALAAIDDPPPIVSVLGHPHLLSKRAVAIVGSRNASINGRRFAERLAADLGQAGFLVVSGFARGIDTAAHVGSLPFGTGAIMAGGIDMVYPEENRGLYRDIAERGVMVAETAIGSTPQARHFPRRNRIIAGLSLGVAVVEAAPRSGSLITARMALDQGREVFAVPGSPLDPRSAGANGLIRQGALLIESADDVVQALSHLTRKPLGEPQGDLFAAELASPAADADLDRARLLVVESLSPSPVPVDELIRGCQLSASVVRGVLLELDLAGRVQHHPGNQISLIHP